MKESGLKLLAAELAEQIRKKTADTLTRRMYVHVKGMPRRQEVEELHDSKKYKTALAQALADDKLYRDCIELNVQPGSLLVARYMEDEEAFDAVADNCTKNCTKKIISHARKYTVKKEKQLLSKYDINELIYEVRGRVKAEFIRNIKYHLLNDRLETINNYDNGGYWDDAWTRSVPVDPENYDDFAEYFADMSEDGHLAFAGYHALNFGELLASAIDENHDEIAGLKFVKTGDVWADELYEKGEEIY